MPDPALGSNTIGLNQTTLTAEQWRLLKLGANASNVVYNADIPIALVPPGQQVLGPGYVLDSQPDFRFTGGGINQPYASESGWVAIDKVVDVDTGGKALILHNAATNEIMISFAGMDGIGNGQDTGSAIAYGAVNQTEKLRPLIQDKLSNWTENSGGVIDDNTHWIISGQSMGLANAFNFAGMMISADTSKAFTLPNGTQVRGSKIDVVGWNGEGVSNDSLRQASGVGYAELQENNVGMVLARVGNVMSPNMAGDLVSALVGYPLPAGAGVAQFPADGVADQSITGFHSMHTGVYTSMQSAIEDPNRILIAPQQTFAAQWTVDLARWVATLGDPNPGTTSNGEGYVRAAIVGAVAGVASVPGDASGTIGATIGQMFNSPDLGRILGWGSELLLKAFAFTNPLAFLKSILGGLGLAAVLDPGSSTQADRIIQAANAQFGPPLNGITRTVYLMPGSSQWFVQDRYSDDRLLLIDQYGNRSEYDFAAGTVRHMSRSGIVIDRDANGDGTITWRGPNGAETRLLDASETIKLQTDGSVAIQTPMDSGATLTTDLRQGFAAMTVTPTSNSTAEVRIAGGSAASQAVATLVAGTAPSGAPSVTVATTQFGHTIEVRYVEDANGNFVADKLLSVDGQPPVDDRAYIAALNQQGITPENLAENTPGARAFAVADSNNQPILDANGNPTLVTPADTLRATDPLHPTGTQTLQNAIPTLIDALSLLKAIQSGQPLPILASGLTLANQLVNPAGQHPTDYNLSGAANAAGSILSLMSLDAALKRGDSLAALTAGAQALSFGAQAYTDFLIAQNGGDAIGALLDNQGAFAFSEGLGKALPYLNLVNSIAHGDMTGAAIGTLQILASNGIITGSFAVAIPYIGWAYAIYSIVDSLFGGDEPDIPDPWGTGQYIWNGNGISYQSAGVTGGNEAVSAVMSNVLNVMNALIERERQQNPGSSLGIIPNRMPSVGYDMSGYRYTDIDVLTGAEKHPSLRFNTSGRPYNATPGTPESYQSIIEGMLYSALSRGAIAPLWEVQTAKLQTDAGDPRAGLTEEERAGRDGQLAAPITGTTQILRPVALDLDGDGIETTDKAHGVAFDVDDSGYLKQTAWVKGDDAMLTLDRNYNGQIDSGREIFSNSSVALGRRGLAGMQWVDSNYDGRLTAADPVWGELKVWKDTDQDGMQDAGETQGLAAMGISELNYAMGTFTQNGQVRQMGSPDLEADKDGTVATFVPGGILIQNSADHQLSLIVTRVDDKTAVEANRDGVSGYEDVETIISTADLLANDTFGGQTGSNLSVTGLTNFRHGTGYIDVNKMVHFIPEANYAGTDAGFDYTVKAVNGQTGTAGVDIALQNVNDAPTAADQRTYRAIYGYTPVQYSTDESGNTVVVGGGEPIYTPYSEPGTWWNGWQTVYHNTPVAWEDTSGGRVVGSDVDDPASSLSYQVVGNPQYGAVTMDAQGNYQYTAWSAPDGQFVLPTMYQEYRIYPGTDAFQVRVSDPHGASTLLTVSVPHPGSYVQPPPPGGGGGGKKPIAIDLDQNGFSFTKVDDSNVFFDVNGDGWKHRMSWIKPGDGLLAYDPNGTGAVTDICQIALARYGQNAQTDLEGLAAFDTNHDGVFDHNDTDWGRFGVWQDANANGVSEAGEFKTLDQLGIAAISLTSDGQFSVVDGDTIHGIAKVTMADGTQRDAADVTLAYSQDVQVPQADGSTTVAPQSPFSPSGEQIDGTAGKDLLLGKTGNNIVNGYAGDDVIFEDGGNDVIDGGDGNDVIYAGADNDLVMGGNGDDVVYAGLGSDVVFGGDGNDAILAEGGNDVVFGGAGNDMIAGGSGNDVLSGDDGDDQIYGESGNDALFGRDGNDTLLGMEGYDHLEGDAGNDLLDGGANADEMIGGAGDDVYVVDDVGDVVTELADEGNDTVRSSIDYALGANVENLTLTGNASLTATGNDLDNVLTGNAGASTLIGGAGNDTLVAGAGVTTMIGGPGNDTFVVNKATDVVEAQAGGNHTIKTSVSYAAAANVATLVGTGNADITLTGNDMANTIVANAGDTTLIAGSGVATMIGGTGDNTFVVNRSDDIVIEQPNAGIDTVLSSVDYVAPENVEILQLTGTADLTATGNGQDNILIGNAGNSTLIGGDGNDTLVAGSGATTMMGGAGNDVFVVNKAEDAVTEAVDGGNDTIRTSVSYTASANVENLTGTGGADLTLTGNDLVNVITSNAGNTTLIAGAGAATMIGGAGNNTFVVNNAADVVIEQANAGNDAILTSVSYTAAANVETMTGTGSDDLTLTGNDMANTIVANSGNTTLVAGAGVATMVGGVGDNVFVVNNAADVVIEQADAGNDTIRSSVSYTAAANVENLTGIGSADITLTGNDLANVITANGGNTTLVAGTGAATMIGGAGNNTFVINKVMDTVTEQANAGNDTIVTSVSYVLPENVENLVGVGTADLTLVGNDLANRLVANDGNTTLVAGAGVATMIGGAGDNVFVVNNTADVVVEQPGAGNDTILTSVSYTAAANVENLTGTGSADLVLTGNDLANTITSNAGNTTLVAGAGIATMIGGSGDNTFVVNNVADVVVEQAGAGNDTIRSSVSYTAAANVENLTGIGSADITLTGNDLVNVITSNTGNSTLVAGSGVAAMIGGVGNNTFVVNNTADTVVEQPNAGNDTILTSVSYVLPENVENLRGTGNADLTLTGNDLVNIITSNAGNTTLVAGSGVATMIGGAGNNTFVVNNTADTVIEQPNAGNDTILTSVSYTAAANVENLTGTGSAAITLTGNDIANVITSNAGNSTLIAGTGVATMIGGGGDNTFVVNNVADVVVEQPGAGIDTIMTSVSYTAPANVENLRGTGSANITLTGNGLDNTIIANSGNDTLIGGGGNDTFVSGSGNDAMFGGSGDDTYVYNMGSGLDAISDTGGANIARFGSGLSLQNVVVRLTAADGRPYTVDADSHGCSDWWSDWGPCGKNQPVGLTAHLRVLDGNGVEQAGQGMDFSVTVDRRGNFTSPIQTFRFADGSTNSFYDTLVKKDVICGGWSSGPIVTGRNDDIVYAGPRTSAVYLGSGNDTVYASPFGTTVYGGGGTDYMVGSCGNDTFIGGYGVSIMQGGGGNDTLTDTKGKAAMFGGSGNDVLTGGGANDFFASGRGRDVISTGATRSVVAFNAGGGRDTILASPGGASTLSLGGGIDYRNLTFSKSGNDLVLNTGWCDSITFKDWYAGSANHDFVTLQVIEEASCSYNKRSSDPLRNRKIEQFDFGKLVDQFDAALRSPMRTMEDFWRGTPNSWSLMNGLLDAHLSGSDTAAVGGDLAYQFGSRGGLSGMDLSAIQATLTDPQFGKAPQAIHTWNSVSQTCKTLC